MLGLLSREDSGSVSSSLGRMKVSGTPSSPPGTPDLERKPPTGLLWLGSAMTEGDHDTFESATAFFKESMRRDAMIGTITVPALQDMYTN